MERMDNQEIPVMNALSFQVVNSVSLKNGMYALAGIVNGEVPDVGWFGVSSNSNSNLRIEVVGIGVVDPNLVQPDVHSLLVNVISGDEREVDGSTFEFAPEAENLRK